MVNFRIVKKVRTILIVVVLVALAIGGTFFAVGYFKPRAAGILIDTHPAASVIIEGEQLGRTPYKDTRKAGEVVIKLIPESFDEPLAPYETRVNLVSGIETVITRDFGESEESSGGEIISFEKTGGDEASLSIVSIPDSAQISIDGTTRAFTPYKTSSIPAGKHIISISSPRFLERTINVKTVKGYKLTAIVKLVPSEEEPKPEGKEEVEEEEKESEPTKIEILSTPTGFLRVRGEPSTLGQEVGQVEPGDQFVLITEDEKTGWFKIEFEEGEEGWISNQYAKILGEDENSSEATSSAETDS